MSDKPDEGKLADVNVGLPSPTFTEPEAQPLHGLALKPLQDRLEALEKNILGQLKALQGDKDRRIPKLESNLQELMSEVARLKGHGFSDEEAINEVEFRQSVKELVQKIKGTEQPVQAAGTGVSGAGQEAQQIIKELQLDTSDPDVLALLAGKYRNYDHLRAEAALLVARKSSKPTPTSAASPPLPGGAQVSPDLEAGYIKEMRAARGKRDVARAIQAKYRQAGLDIDTIVFSV